MDLDRRRFEELKEKENEKFEYIEGLLNKNEQLSDELQKTRDELEQWKTLATVRQVEAREEKQKVKKWEELMRQECHTFVLVLVDGDCLNFRDEFVRNAELGGQDAARKLKSSVIEYVNGSLGIGQGVGCVIRVYANMKGLGKVYRDINVLEQASDVGNFVRGFNMGDPLSDFVDAGAGKECADEKIREVFKMHIENVRCKHIIFGGPADNGYARLLGPFSRNEHTNKRVTMLEGPPFAKELLGLAGKFRTTSFPSVFRNTPLLIRGVTFSTTPLKSSRTPPSNYVSTITFGALSGTNLDQMVLPISPSRSSVLRNSRGQRVDPPLQVSVQIVSNLKHRKLCHQYHLLGHCAYVCCKHEHGKRLIGRELEAERFIARLSPCTRGLQCSEENCILGHRCQIHPAWPANGDCRFSKEMHGVDMKVVKT